MKQFHAHRYWRQVNLDVDRSHRRFPAGKLIILFNLLFPYGSNFVYKLAVTDPPMIFMSTLVERQKNNVKKSYTVCHEFTSTVKF